MNYIIRRCLNEEAKLITVNKIDACGKPSTVVEVYTHSVHVHTYSVHVHESVRVSPPCDRDTFTSKKDRDHKIRAHK